MNEERHGKQNFERARFDQISSMASDSTYPKNIRNIRAWPLYVIALYLSLGRTEEERQHAYRALFRAELDQEAISDIRLAMNQNQPIGNGRFHAQIEKMTGAPREAKPRGRPRAKNDQASTTTISQRDLGL